MNTEIKLHSHLNPSIRFLRIPELSNSALGRSCSNSRLQPVRFSHAAFGAATFNLLNEN